MIYYIIKNIHTWANQSGELKSRESYYEHDGILIPFTVWGNLEDARKFDCRSEAKRFIQKRFTASRTNQYTVEKITKPEKL